MSKSTKNFTKIKEITEKYSHNAIRMYFVMHNWNAPMDYSEESMKESVEKEKYINGFFQNAKIYLKENDLKRDLKFDNIDLEMSKFFDDKRKMVHEFLIDNANTPGAFNSLYELISKTYAYVNKTNGKTLKMNLLFTITSYLDRMFKMFGLIYNTGYLNIAKQALMEKENLKQNDNKENINANFIDVIVGLRDDIRGAAISKDLKKLFEICDNLRDKEMPKYGIKIEDRQNTNSIWKYSNNN